MKMQWWVSENLKPGQSFSKAYISGSKWQYT